MDSCGPWYSVAGLGATLRIGSEGTKTGERFAGSLSIFDLFSVCVCWGRVVHMYHGTYVEVREVGSLLPLCVALAWQQVLLLAESFCQP